MKPFTKIVAVLFILFMSSAITAKKVSAQPVVSFQLFYDQLSPYGSWVDYPNYGYAWIPSAGADFSPYGTGGHWVFSTYGWTWVSDYSWGWAPFHYGRWYFDPIYGWIWVPDTEWGPAWVVWRSNPGYYGWAPMRPGVSINIAFGPSYNVPNNWWVFVPNKYINSPNVYNYYAPRNNNVTIINNTTVINKTYSDNSRHATYVYGPDRENVQKVTGTTIRPVAIKESDKPGENLSNGELRIYRPQVQKSTSSAVKPTPRRVTNLKDVKPVNQRNAGAPQKAAPNNNATQQPAQQKKISPDNKTVSPDNKKQTPPRTVSPNSTKPSQQPERNVAPPKNEQQRQEPPRSVDPKDQKAQPEQRNVNPEEKRDVPKQASPAERPDQPQTQPRYEAPKNDPSDQRKEEVQNGERQEPPQTVAPQENTKEVPQQAPVKKAPQKKKKPK